MNAQDRDAWPRVTHILKATGVADFTKIPNAEYYLQRGTDVHMICDSVDRNEPDYWTGGDLEGYAAAWIKFKENSGFVPRLIEGQVYNVQRMYRGTLDRFGHFDDDPDDRVLLDIKSGIVADWVALQTAAYAACLDSPQTIRRFGLQLKKDGTYRLSPEFKDYRRDSNYFFALVATIHGRTLYGRTELEEQ